jgi:drug/metabolite transporter (DMT)-like permease
MSSKIYIGAAVSSEERGQWVYIVAIALTYVAYIVIILGRAAQAPPAEVDYAPTMLLAIGAGIALAIVGRIVLEIAAQVREPDAGHDPDVRDRDIGRFGEYVAGTVLGVGMIVPFALTLAEFEYFWIANAMYLAFVVAALVGTAVKLVAYRRGF